ncbi:hypothetical protein CYANOKiyG1_38130 [Okeania sp. KiyG1]|nr:hypothetical protein CYANOKiyG1_38130 [Okeania sp. KiyG1]
MSVSLIIDIKIYDIIIRIILSIISFSQFTQHRINNLYVLTGNSEQIEFEIRLNGSAMK